MNRELRLYRTNSISIYTISIFEEEHPQSKEPLPWLLIIIDIRPCMQFCNYICYAHTSNYCPRDWLRHLRKALTLPAQSFNAGQSSNPYGSAVPVMDPPKTGPTGQLSPMFLAVFRPSSGQLSAEWSLPNHVLLNW